MSADAVDRIWNGWRSQYVNAGGPTQDGTGSVFTQLLQSGLPDERTFVVHRGRLVVALLNAYPYTSGHVLVVPMREIADVTELSVDEAAELWATVTDAVAAVRAAYHPGGVNVGINLGRAAGGSINEHLHVHVVPRWAGDGNFMTAIATARTLPEPLDESAAKLRAAWPRP